MKMENEVRLIDANALLEKAWDVPFETNDAHFVKVIDAGDVEEAPTIDTESLRPKGHWNIRCYSTYDSWTQETDEEFYLECSECKREVWNIDQSAAMGGEYRKLIEQFPYCHCGAKMEG